MIDLQLFQFSTAPRTGTAWLLKAASLAGLGDHSEDKAHQPHATGPSQLLRVSLVRHPCDWLASYYSGVHRRSTNSPADSFMQCDNSSFESFVRSYLRTMPGGVGQVFFAYNADSYMKLEDMPWAFAELLESAGVPRPLRQRIYDLKAQNCSSRRVSLKGKLRRQVLEAEERLVEEFDYY
jgi:hypothetical protein